MDDCGDEISKQPVLIVVFGASGDLAKKKTFPALFRLYQYGYLHPSSIIIGYARSKLTLEDFHDRIRPYLKSDTDEHIISQFLTMCLYQDGPYDMAEGYEKLGALLCKLEEEKKSFEVPHGLLRLFYLALPPSVFIDAAKGIKQYLYKAAQSRLIIEKPFGKDLTTSNDLSMALATLFQESEVSRPSNDF
jgi:glucose-6-phosphate 1-dehydrogenase